MTRRVPDRHIADVAQAFRNYPDGARADLALAWPDLYYSVARLTSHWEIRQPKAKRTKRGRV